MYRTYPLHCRAIRVLGIIVAMAMNLGSLRAQSDRNLVAQPAQVTLRGNFAQAQLLIQEIDPSAVGNPSAASELSLAIGLPISDP